MNLVWLVHFIKWRRFRFVVYATVHKALIEQSLSTGEYKDSTFKNKTSLTEYIIDVCINASWIMGFEYGI